MATESPLYPTFACNRFSSQSDLDQPTYKSWQHGRKRDAEGKGDSPWVQSWKSRACECCPVEKYSLWNKTKDGEPYTLKGVRTVREGGHAIPTGSTVSTLPFSNIMAGSVGFFTKAGLLGGGTVLMGLLGLVGGATL